MVRLMDHFVEERSCRATPGCSRDLGRQIQGADGVNSRMCVQALRLVCHPSQLFTQWQILLGIA